MGVYLLLIPIMLLSLSETALSEVYNRADSHHDVDTKQIGIDEKPGGNIPLDISLIEEDGRSVKLTELIKGPTVIILAYYNCINLCPTVLEATARLLENTRLKPLDDFSVITISFNDSETPEDAVRVKRDYLKAIGRPFPDEGWRFLTGKAAEIKRLTDAVGFNYKREGDDFLHPSALIIISGDGHITRYLYGQSFLPFDFEMAITEAAAGKSGPSIRKAILLCFSYDPVGRRYVFNTLKVTGIVVLTSALAMLVLVTRKRKT
ncbi:MAG: SCO family protein [Nitrospirae bacterium]|nr:SCO family protein [Nitrospirota bacterium]